MNFFHHLSENLHKVGGTFASCQLLNETPGNHSEEKQEFALWVTMVTTVY